MLKRYFLKISSRVSVLRMGSVLSEHPTARIDKASAASAEAFTGWESELAP